MLGKLKYIGPSGVEIAIAKLYSDHISAELIQAGRKILLRTIYSLILFAIGNNCLISGTSIIVPIDRRVIKL
jgi:hypothetical protein